ncbi:MAG: glycoside hydrolase family 10 protein [Lachnospiraceae bacterium]
MPSAASSRRFGFAVGELSEEVRRKIASVYNINYPSRPDLTADELKSEFDAILENALRLGLNTLFFQVRPCDDALYSSNFFRCNLIFHPMERYSLTRCVCRRNVTAKASHFTQRVNPPRIRKKIGQPRSRALRPASGQGCRAFSRTAGLLRRRKLYYNAGVPEVCELVKKCVTEIVENYDVDGIVFDDYFYPYPTYGAEFDDADAYAKYGNGAERDDWRRENINMIIKACHDGIKAIRSNCKFGVAPFGIWQNDNGSNKGSETSGLEGYSSLYCDALAWAREGYVDYLSPQLYWEFESASAPFGKLCEWWNASLDGTECDFIPSLASYRYDEDWSERSGEMQNQLRASRRMITYRGAVFYGFAALCANSSGISDEVNSAYKSEYLYYPASPYIDKISVSYPKTA